MPEPILASTAWLLGAGASKEAGLPLAAELTQQLLDRQSGFGRNELALRFVVGSIIAFDARSGGRPDVLPDVERVVSAVELLSTRRDLEVAPFVASWDATVESLERTQRDTTSSGSAVNDLIRGLGVAPPPFRGARPPSLDVSRVGRALNRIIDQHVGGNRLDVFGALLGDLLRDLRAVVVERDAGDVAYLEPVVRLGATGAPIATLNYDLTVERAAEQAGVAYSRGIDTWSQSGELKWSSGSMRLFKLHGSIDWVRGTAQTGAAVSLNIPRAVIDASQTPTTSSYRPFLVFGQREKLRPEGPFLQLLEAFRNSLRGQRDLVVVGYAFRDGHINELIAQWLAGNPTRRRVVVDPNFPEEPTWGDDSRQSDLVRYLRDPIRATGRAPRQSRLGVIRAPSSVAIRKMSEPGALDFLDALFADEPDK